MKAVVAAEAMALAWLNTWAPDALCEGYVEPGTVPFDVPDGFVFKLTPPWQADLFDLSIGNDFDFPLELPPQMPLCQCFHIVVGVDADAFDRVLRSNNMFHGGDELGRESAVGHQH